MINESEIEGVNEFKKDLTQEDANQHINVERVIANLPKKPFLGGFRHKVTGVEFLNVSCQTNSVKFINRGIEKFDRDTQTVQNRNQSLQTCNNASTQMTKPGCYVSDATDKILIPGKYITADVKEKEKINKVIILQSYWRRWLAKRVVDNLRSDQEQRIKWEKELEENKVAERADRLHREFERRMHPQTKGDFDLLYAALEKWRKEEILRIDSMHSGPERKAALIGLLEQESFLIQFIERHHIKANKENLQQHILSFLNKAAKPKFWRAFDGRKTEMYTEHTLRAKELHDLYNSLQMTYLTQSEREDVLCTVRQTVQEYSCKLTEELCELVNREIDLLTRGVKEKNLEGLRLRISTLFLQFCKNPKFNPEVTRLLKVPDNPFKLLKNIFFCPSCNSYLPSSEFPLASNSKNVARCTPCMKLDNTARLRHDFSKIHAMLLHLRLSEEILNDGSQIAYLIQDADMQYLVEIIWGSQSALSGLSEISELVLVRWNKHEHWAPWNCILLSKDESLAHLKLDNALEAYGRIFIGKVQQKHLLAKNYFSKLYLISKKMVKTNNDASKSINM